MCLFPPSPRPSALAVVASFWKTALTLLQSLLCLPMADQRSPDPPIVQPLPKGVSTRDEAEIWRRKGYILFQMVPQVARSPPAHPHFCPLYSGCQREQRSALTLSIFPAKCFSGSLWPRERTPVSLTQPRGSSTVRPGPALQLMAADVPWAWQSQTH